MRCQSLYLHHKACCLLAQRQQMQSAVAHEIMQDGISVTNSQRAPCRQLLRDPEVMFAGYKFPHPLEYHIFIKVQTIGKKPPREAFDDALTSLIGELNDIRDKFQVCQASFKTGRQFKLSMTRSPCRTACTLFGLAPHTSCDSLALTCSQRVTSQMYKALSTHSHPAQCICETDGDRVCCRVKLTSSDNWTRQSTALGDFHLREWREKLPYTRALHM